MSGKHVKKIVLAIVLFLSAFNALTVVSGPKVTSRHYTPMEGCSTTSGECPE